MSTNRKYRLSIRLNGNVHIEVKDASDWYPASKYVLMDNEMKQIALGFFRSEKDAEAWIKSDIETQLEREAGRNVHSTREVPPFKHI